MIKRKQTINAMIPVIMKKTDISLVIHRVTVIDETPGTDSMQTEPVTKIIVDYTNIENNKLIRTNIDTIMDKMCDSSIVFRYGDNTKSFSETSRRKPTAAIVQLCYGATEKMETLLLNGIWGKRSPESNTYSFAFKFSVDSMHGTEDKYLSSDGNIYDALPDGYTHYSCLGNSPSGERRSMILCGSDAYDWEAIINHASDDFLSINRGEKSYKQMAKESAKLFQCLAGSKSFGTCRCIAIYNKKFAEDRYDGMCWGSSEALAYHIKEACDKEVHPGALNGMFLQGRIAQGKYGCVIIPNKLIINKVHYLAKRDGVEIKDYTWDEVKDPEIKQQIINKDIPLVIIGDKDAPIDVLLDANTLKSVYDVSIAPEYTILRVLKGDSQVHYSATIFAKCAMKDAETTKAMTKKMFEYDFISSAQRNLKSEGRVLSLDTFDTDNIFLRDVLVGAFPEYARRDSNVALDIVKNLVDTANKKINRMGISVKGSGKGIIVGPENLSQECILGECEMYNRHLIKMFEELGIPESEAYVAGFKYPTMDVDEYEIYNLVSLQTVKQRLGKNVKNEVLRKNLEHEYFMYQDSIAVMPCSEAFKQKHAGSDFDTDMMQFLMVLTDKAYDIIKETRPYLAGEMQCYNQLYHILKHDPVIVKIDQ